jgi:hypothetical protein
MRKRTVLTLGVVPAVLVSATTYAAWPEPDPHSKLAPSPTSSPTPSSRPRVVRYDADPRLIQPVPKKAQVRSLPRLRTALPATLDVDLAARSARPLQDDPVDYALAVMQADPQQVRPRFTRWSQVRVFILGTDRRWRWLNATQLGLTGPPPEAYAFGNNSLSADGTRLAVANEGSSRLVVADLTTGRIKRLRLPFRDPIFPTWSPDGTTLFTQDRRRTPASAVRVDVATGRVTPFPHNVFALGFTPEGGLAVLQKGTTAQLTEFDPSGKTSTATLPLVIPSEDRPWISRAAVAVLRQGDDDEHIGEVDVLVFDRRTGQPLAQLAAPASDPWIGIEGWLTEDTLLLQLGNTGNLIAWHHPTRKLSLVSHGTATYTDLALPHLR